jgi:gliding motility-associated-like protein
MKLKSLFFFLLIALSSFAQNSKQTIGFKENKGQIIDQNGKPNDAVKYLLNSRGLNVQLKKNGFSYDVYETKKHPIKQHIHEKSSFASLKNNDKKLPDYTLEYVFHRIDIDFVNANTNVELVTEQASPDYDNYYNVPNKPEGIVNIYQYQQITYKNIYPNIDVVFSIPKDTLKTVEYNFVVHPDGKTSDIQLKFNGAKTDLVDNKIRMSVRFGEMEETLPSSWTEDGMSKKEINVCYTKIKENVYGFTSSENVLNKTVIIDPVPTRLWGTFYGGENEENILSLEIDILGNSYICGTTSSMNFIATTGAHQIVFGSSIYYGPHLYITDGFVAKFDKNGIRLWSTFYGGNLNDDISDIAISNNGLVGFCGNSWSDNNISTIGTFKDFKSGSYGEMYFGVLNPNGARLWASYYGNDNGLNLANCISVDKQNFFYISGTTTSDEFISTPNSFKEAIIDNNRFDGFLAKFDQNGNRIWGTYFGGDKDDYVTDLTLDSNNNVILVGYTISTNGISTPNSYQQYLSSNENYDGFIASFTNTGVLKWGTYFGGTEDDKILRVKNYNNTLYFSGTTNSNDLATPNAFETINQYGTSFISKFNIQNQQKIWLSYSSPDITDFDINQNEEIYLVGNAKTIRNIATSNAFNTNNNGFVSFIRKINNNCEIIWGTYLGSKGFIDDPYIKYLNNDIFYVGGTCYSYWSSPQFTNYGLTTPNSFQELSNGNREAFINKFKDCNLSSLASSNSPICVGSKIELKALGGTDYSWTGPNNFTSTDQNPTITNATELDAGKYNCNITGTGGCDGFVSVEVLVGDKIAPVPNLATLPTITGDCNTTISTFPTAIDVCAGQITATTTNPLSYSLPGTYIIIWKYDDGNGNSINQNQTVSISSQPLPTTTSPQDFCIQQNAAINEISITGQNIKWYDTSADGNLLANSTALQNGTTYYASQTINGCESDRIPVLINIQNTAAPTASANQTFCSSQNPTLNTIVISGTAIKWYNSTGSLLPNSTALQDGVTYYTSQTESGCESQNRLAVSIALIISLPANDYAELLCDDLNDGSEKVNLSKYNLKLISNTSAYTFSYYSSYTAAENQSADNQITDFSNFKLVLGDNKIYVRINSNTPCYAISELKLSLLSKPQITIPDIVPICENNTITIDAGSGYDSYLWSNAATTSSINVDNPGNYSVTVTNNYTTISCSSSKSFEVRKSNIATINSIDTQDWKDNQNTIIVYATGTGDFEYSIDGTNFQDSNQFLNIMSGQYTVHVRDKNGCGTVTDEVYLLMYPKFFTPNGDGFNDSWKIKFSDFEIGLSIKLFDRYGKLIKELLNNIGWDGTFNNHELPATDYWFVVSRANGTQYKGHFSLKR